ncbi:MAG: DUF2905 domain-containing protein [Chloroflexota bacterium]
MAELGRAMLFIGLGIAVLGALLWLGARFFPWLGNLPGDIRIEGENTKVFIPITTMIIVSIAGTIILNVLIRFFRR